MKAIVSGEEMVLRSIGCQKTDPSYAEYEKAYREVIGETLSIMKPRAKACIDSIPDDFPKSVRFYGRKLIFYCISLGSEVTDLVDAYMQKGEYIKGMIVDGIADNCLFSCEKFTLCEIEKYAREKCFGIEGIFDAPDSIEGQMQKLIASKLDAERTLGVKVTENYMMTPVKTYAAVMPIIENSSVMKIFHDCSICDKKDCSFRKV